MGRIAFLFSGQGSQYPGMGNDFFNNSDIVKSMYANAERYREGTIEQCFDGSKEELLQTENTQPCLYLADLAAALRLKEKGIIPSALAGFSLGEIPALAFSEAFSLQDGFEIACQRGKFMAEAAKEHTASMLAVIKLKNAEVETICEKYKNIYPVNYNSQEQLVVAGIQDELEAFKTDVKNMGGKTIQLAVSGGFHSPFMNSAKEKFLQMLQSKNINLPKIPVYSNYTALPYTNDIKSLMGKQINKPVRWERTILQMGKSGIDTFIEVGVGAVLCKLATKILPSCTAYAVENEKSLNKVLEDLGKDV